MRVTALNNTLHLSRRFLSLFLILFSSSRLPNCSQLAAARSDTGNANDLPPAPQHPRAAAASASRAVPGQEGAQQGEGQQDQSPRVWTVPLARCVLHGGTDGDTRVWWLLLRKRDQCNRSRKGSGDFSDVAAATNRLFREEAGPPLVLFDTAVVHW